MRVGTPLKRIKEYLENQDIEFFLKVLTQKGIQLDKELKKILDYSPTLYLNVMIEIEI